MLGVVRILLAAVLLSACSERPDLLCDLDHTSYSAILDKAECDCLLGKTLVVSPNYPRACMSPWIGDRCGIRLDCGIPEGDPDTWREVLACQAPRQSP